MHLSAKNSLVQVPILGSAGCGSLIPFSSTRRQTQVAVRRFEQTRSSAFVACGDSMIDRGIRDGDILICETVISRSEAAFRICVVLVCGDYMAKIVVPNPNGTLTLRSANPHYSDLVFEPEAVKIVGIVKRIQREIA